MRIALQTWGSDGDIRPMIALAAGLVRRGHSAALSIGSVDDKDYGPMCSAVGVESVRAPERALSDVTLWYEKLGQTKNPFKMIRFLHEEGLFPAFESMSRAAEQLVAGADLAVGHFLSLPLLVAAQKRKLPHATVTFWPGLVRDPARPPDGLPNLGRAINGLLWSAGFKLIERAVGAGYRRWFEQQGLAAPGDVMESLYSHQLNLVAASGALWPHVKDVGPHRLCGAFAMPGEAEPEPLGEELERFLASGPPPVFLTLGSLGQIDAAASERMLLDAAAASGERAIVQRDPRRPLLAQPGERLAFVGRTSHAALLPRCAAVLHHGGAGTSQTALAAGRASVVLGFMEEQLSWGRTLVRSGVAQASFRYGGPDGKTLGAALGKAARDPAMRARAEALGAKLREEDGVRAACVALEALVAR